MVLVRFRKGGGFWLTPGLFLVCLLGLAPSAPAQDTAPARVPCLAVHALSENDFAAWVSRLKIQGYRLTDLSAYLTGAAPHFAGVAIKDGKNYAWEMQHGLTEQQYQHANDDFYKKGYRPVSVSAYQQNNGTRFASLWVKDDFKGGWEVHYGLTEQQYRQHCDDLYKKKGRRVLCISGYGVANDVRFAAVWVGDKKEWVGRHHLTEQQYRQAYDEFRPKGYRPESASAYLVGKETRFAVIFTKGAKDYWEARHNLTQAQYQAEFERWGKQGGRPLLVCGYPLGKETRYAAVFVGDTATKHAMVGDWGTVMPWPALAIHAALLPNRKVLIWAHLEDDADYGKAKKDPLKDWLPNIPRADGSVHGLPHLWDSDHPADMPKATARPPFNMFCSGHAFLGDGRLLVAGGHQWYNFWGDDKVTLYDFSKNAWSEPKSIEKMNNRRWYPSCVTLPSGDVLVLGGTFKSGEFNLLPQVWKRNWVWEGYGKPGPWRDLTGADLTDTERKEFYPDIPQLISYYPFLHVAPNGKVFKAGPNRRTWYLDTKGLGKWEPVYFNLAMPVAGFRVFPRDRDYGSSVMYAPGKVLTLGGSLPPTATAEVIDLTVKHPSWKSIESMWSARRHMNATLLADGTVFVSGGTATSSNFNDPKTGKKRKWDDGKPVLSTNDVTGAVLTTELWDPHAGPPETVHWIPMAAQSEPRLYHSTALLLPDGSVLSAGGGEPGADTAPNGAWEKAGLHRNAQIFKPPYFFRGPRPVISSAPQTVHYGQHFEVKTPDAAHIRRVTFIRLGSATHARNFGQHINHLTSKAQGASLIVTAPANANLAPPGHYMLFILNDKGVPSVSKIIHIG